MVTPISSFPTGSVALVAAANIVNPLTNATAVGSPVTEIFNGSDYIFFSVTAGGSQSTCTGPCVYSYTVTSAPAATISAGLAAAGGTSGIIIDNVATTPTGASQVYFSTLGSQSCAGVSGGCAVQASQSGLN